LKTFILLLGLAGAAGSVYANTISYTFNFSGGTPNAAGTFDYDSSTSTFSNVMVAWDGAQFGDFTDIFNESSPPNLCGSLDGPAAIFQILAQGTCGGAEWTAASFAASHGTEYGLTFIFSDNPGWHDITIQGITVPFIRTSGIVSASAAVPEPASSGLCITGAALLAWIRRRRGVSARQRRS
jgi:hypothetical protein